MPNTRLVVAQGLINGLNRVFLTGEPYVSGSTAYILNGRIHSQGTLDSRFGYVESNSDTGEITVNEAPVDGDVVLIYFQDRRVAPVPKVQTIIGVTASSMPILGVVQSPAPTPILGVAQDPASTPILGVVQLPKPSSITGIVLRSA